MNKFKDTEKQCNTAQLSAIKRTAVGKHILYCYLLEGINIKRGVMLDIRNLHNHFFNQATG